MTIKKGLFFAFAAIIVIVPIYVAVSSQNVLNNGKLYKFKPMASQPFDSYSGEFLRVNYEANNIPTKFDFEERETAYVSIGVDKEGYAFFEEAFKSKPENDDYLKTTILWSGIDTRLKHEIEMAIEDDDFLLSSIDARSSVNIRIPDKMSAFFINKDDALKAEKVIAREDTYFAVRYLGGKAVLEDIYVSDQPILDFIHTNK